MHLPSFLFVATAASTLASARVDRLSSSHREFARSYPHSERRHVVERDAMPDPAPYRLFDGSANAKPGVEFAAHAPPSFAFVSGESLSRRADHDTDDDSSTSIDRLGNAVGQVATALKLDLPPIVQLATVNDSAKTDGSAPKKKRPAQKKNKVCRKKTADEKRRDRAAKQSKAATQQLEVQAPQEKKKGETKTESHKSESAHTSSSSPSHKASSSSESKSSSSGSSKKDENLLDSVIQPVRSLIGFSATNCGSSGASDEFPNGSESWLNCGLDRNKPSSGWNPPKGVTLDHITTVSIEHALKTNSVWEPCKPFISLFERIGAETDLPPILLAAFALQESTCNPNTQGDNGGAFGLMQITQDKCGGRDAKGCSEPEYNVRTAAKYFRTELSNRGGEFLEALGAYNGWYPGLTYSGATAAAYSGCCECQQNLDYLHQMTNGWLQGKTGYEMGSWKNLAVCH